MRATAFVLLLVTAAPASAADLPYRVGVANTDITPDHPIRLNVRDVRVLLKPRGASRIGDHLGCSLATELGGHVVAGGTQVLRSLGIAQANEV